MRIETVKKAELYFILAANSDIDFSLVNVMKNDTFLNRMIEVQKDELDSKLNAAIQREKIYEGTIECNKTHYPLNIYINNFTDYNSSLIYIKLTINKDTNYKDYINLIYGKNILYNSYVEKASLFDYLKKNKICAKDVGEIFLFQQIEELEPALPSDYKDGLSYIEKHKQDIHQLLLRSDTHSAHLRIDNHESNFESISNFYGTIDLCSPVTLLQFYQHPISSINDCKIDMQHRACWWLVTMDMIFVQKMVLTDILKRINEVQTKNGSKTIKATTQIGRVLINMKDFWYFEDLTHEITKKVVDKVKGKIGIVSLLNSVLERIEYLENLVLRENNEKQNSHNLYLNLILLAIAAIQIVPIIFEILETVNNSSGISITKVTMWSKAFLISITLPLLALLVRKVNNIRLSRSNVQLKTKMNKND
ncbi:MAG: hypothetical protein COC06_12625 [Bacteroidales bacterium]|nr:MAG: hypothetical protein COC06_12625 [Bacteroidales bacterium]